jgi:hypothetical protein
MPQFNGWIGGANTAKTPPLQNVTQQAAFEKFEQNGAATV